MQQIPYGVMHMSTKPKTFDIEGQDLKASFEWLTKNPVHILHVDKIVEGIAAARQERAKQLETFKGGEHVQHFVIPHNAKNSADSTIAERPLRLLKTLSSIQYVRQRAPHLKVLSIGPRTEAELMGLLRLGFDIENIESLDLMSYSPYITKGDMHDLPYEDNSFDVIVAGWVLAYSSNNQRVADEILRVAKTGALITIGCNGEPYGNPDWAEAEQKSEWYVGGVPCLKKNDTEYNQHDKIVHRFWNTGQIYRLFKDHVTQGFFNYDRQVEEEGYRVELITVFRVKQ